MKNKNRHLTPFGREVKMRLLEKGMSQKQFCLKHSIPEIRLCEILYGVIKGHNYKVIIMEQLGIPS